MAPESVEKDPLSQVTAPLSLVWPRLRGYNLCMHTDQSARRAPAASRLTGLLLLLVGCVASKPEPLPPVPQAASEAFALGRSLRTSGAAPDDPAVLQALAEARALAPDWLAPARMEDDLLLEELRGPEALERRRHALAADPRSAQANYLAARLEGRAAGQRFERAVALESREAWTHLGMAWWLTQRGSAPGDILRHARLAVTLAREPWERAFFQLRLARVAMDFERESAALEALRESLETARQLTAPDRAWLLAEVALFELECADPQVRARGYERGLFALDLAELAPREVERLARGLSASQLSRASGEAELELALSARGDALSRELRARLLIRDDTDLARALYERDGGRGEVDWGRELRRPEAFQRGWFHAAVEAWLAGLPVQALAEDGLPLRACLREVVEAARALAPRPSAPELERLGQALLAAGWFDEAVALADHLGALDLAAALELREGGAAGAALIEQLAAAVVDLERSSPDLAALVREPGTHAEGADVAPKASGLDDLLRRWSLCFARFAPLGGEHEPGRAALSETPRQEYGPFGSLLHPGPVFSAADEQSGLGERGALVPGLAPQLERLGRFAIVGQVAGGGGPDGTILRLLSLEQREGVHLGVPWSGSVAWCEGTDLLSRAGRQGARVAGAALHEGYWVDVDVVRRDAERWSALRAEYSSEASAPRLAAALDLRGVRLLTPAAHAEQRSRERCQLLPLLGEADRVRLAVMEERAEPGESLGEVSLDELVAAVARHEEGHLCDRTRFLPLSEHIGLALAFVLDAGVSPRAVQERLEYRAHLTALCVAQDPRLPLVEALDSAEGSSLALPHGGAYRKLLAEFLGRLERALLARPEDWPELDPERTLAHQLHRLSAEQVRGLALELAQLEGLAR